MIRMRVIRAGDDEGRAWNNPGWPQLSHDWYGVARRHIWRPPTDVYETEQHIVIKVEIAGMTDDDFVISFTDHRLIIAGRRRDPADKLVYQNMEICYGEFRTEIVGDWAVNQAAIEAHYENGFLFVMLPKREQRVQVRVRDEEQT